MMLKLSPTAAAGTDCKLYRAKFLSHNSEIDCSSSEMMMTMMMLKLSPTNPTTTAAATDCKLHRAEFLSKNSEIDCSSQQLRDDDDDDQALNQNCK